MAANSLKWKGTSIAIRYYKSNKNSSSMVYFLENVLFTISKSVNRSWVNIGKNECQKYPDSKRKNLTED